MTVKLGLKKSGYMVHMYHHVPWFTCGTFQSSLHFVHFSTPLCSSTISATGSRDFTEATHNHNASRRVATWFTCITMFHGSHAELFSLLFTLFTSALHSVQELLWATGSRDFIGATHNHGSKARPQEEWLHGSHVSPCPMVHMQNFSVFSSLCSLQHSTLFKNYFRQLGAGTS